MLWQAGATQIKRKKSSHLTCKCVQIYGILKSRVQFLEGFSGENWGAFQNLTNNCILNQRCSVILKEGKVLLSWLNLGRISSHDPCDQKKKKHDNSFCNDQTNKFGLIPCIQTHQTQNPPLPLMVIFYSKSDL